MGVNFERITEFLLGAVGLIVGGTIVFHWRSTLRVMDKWNNRLKYTDSGYVEVPRKGANVLNPVSLLLFLFFLFFVSLVFMLGYGWEMIAEMSANHS